MAYFQKIPPVNYHRRAGSFFVYAALFLAGILFAPISVRADTLYVANNGNSTLSKVDEKGVVSLVASNINGACGAAFEYGGNVNVLDIDRGRVYRITRDGNVSIAGENLVRPEDLAYNSHGDLFVVNGDGTVRRLQPKDNYAGIFASGLSSPHGIAIDRNDNLYISNYGNGTISKIPANGGPASTFAGGLNAPATLAFGPEGDLYVANTGDHSIVRVSPKGVVLNFAGNVGTPAQVAFDSHGVLYVLNSANGTVLTVDGKTGQPKVFAQGLSRPYGMAFDHALNKHAPIGGDEPPPPPKLGLGMILAFSAPTILIFGGGVLWVIFRKKDEAE